ncbi:MAG: hypothetical protein R6V03_07775 [Kiritimatiellia bacterium]
MNIAPMQTGTWDTLINAALLVFWIRIWAEESDLLFNPYLAGPERIAGKLLMFLGSFARPLPLRAAAAVLVSAVLLLRGFLVPARAAWSVQWGLYQFSCTGGGVALRSLFSFFSFAVFLLKLWSISLIYTFFNPGDHASSPGSALHGASQPFTWFRAEFRPLLLLICSGAVILGLHLVERSAGGTGIQTSAGTPSAFVMLVVMLSAAGIINVLPVISSALFLFVIGSLLSTVTASGRLLYVCREWTDFILGPLKRYPLRVGMFDLTPLIVFFAIGFIHLALISIISVPLRALL